MSEKMGYKFCILMISMGCCIFGSHGQEREQVRMTVLALNHFKSEEDSQFQCRLTSPDDDPNNVTVEALRTGWTRNTAEENPDPPSVVYTTSGRRYHKVNMIDNGNNDAFGVFGCKATKNGKKDTVISTTRMRSDADIVPRNDLFTQTVSIGDKDVTISMNIAADDVLVNELRWRNNTNLWDGSNPGTDPNFGVDTFTIDEPVQLYHAGIYECHRQGDRASAKHGLNLLIVRACPYTTWDPPDCEGVCDSCYNGGVCDENTGRCVCAPGFTGENCSIACGGNTYGYDCEQSCTYRGNDRESKCGGYLFCLVHPFGCRCNTGFKGLDCEAECGPNTFGASCLQSCHCSSDRCNRYTGKCEGTDISCDLGWTGENCQECANGYFGISCTQECHCSSDKCNRESGLCQSGGCLPQWADLFAPYNCQTGLVRATSTRVNALVPVPVICTVIIGPGGNLSALEFVLSRSLDDLDDENITSNGIDQTGNKVTKLFMVSGVIHDLSLYCQLRNSTDGKVAALEVNVSVYDLPELNTAPTEQGTNDTSVTITWVAWKNGKDFGDPPVVHYITYYKGKGDWASDGVVSANDSLEFTFNNLDSDFDYLFSVAAVRQGEGGEGPRSPRLNVTTLCSVPDSPQNIAAKVSGDKQQLVEISWKHPSNDGIGCRSGVMNLKIYYSSTSLSSNDVSVVVVNDTSSTFFIIHDLNVGEEYIFEMTLTTQGGESRRSNQIYYLVPVLPEFSLSPNITQATSTTISITWKAWNEIRNKGTPPVISYNLYHKLSLQDDWEEAVTYNHIDGQNEYYAEVENLLPDTLYDFSVAVVREGTNGEGPMSPTLENQKTKCDVPRVSPINVAATYTGDDQQFANITWQMHQDSELACSTGVDFYTIYTFRQGLKIINRVEDSDVRWSLVEGLPPGETYNFKVTLITSGGESQLNDTNNGANLLLPELPRLSASPYLIDRNSTTIRIGWAAWDEALNIGTPPVVSYNLYHKLSSDLEWQNGGNYDDIEGQDEYNATVKDLNPDTLYHLSVAAVREGPEGEGKRGPSYEEKTVCDVPLDGPQDLVTNVAGEKQELVEISWKLPSDDRIRCSSGVLQFNIYYSSTSLTSKEEIKLLVPDSSVRSYTIFNLEVEEEYIFEMTLITEGGESSRSEYVQHLVPGRNAGAIVGSTMASSLLLVLVIVVVILWLRRDRIRRWKNHKEEPREGTINNAFSIEPLESPTSSKTLSEDEDEAVYANVERPAPIPLVELENYIKTAALEEQFLMFKNESQFPSDVGAKEENKRKNRFRNMIAYDHSRVVLPEQDEDPSSDYYNANYIKNLRGDIGFIASQGPNKASVEDFWRMVWMEKVANIVMLTNLVEQGKDRCIRYWPNSVGETTVFGAVKVKWQSSYQYANFDVRDYEIIIEKKTHRVRNWHFKTWPDKDIPDQPSPLIEFARRVKTQQKDETVPLIVHCSAGVGRTGTFIALYSLMDAVETSEKLDVYGFVEQMREDRINMVQTPKQYKFLHECLFEVYLTGDTAIPINKLTTFDVKNQGEKLGREFKLLAKFDQMSRNAPSDVTNESEKNRFPDLLPVEKKRPYLQSPAKNSSSNYINACSVKSYRKESSFIATQSPLPSTVEDFWRLVFDWKCPLIVMLNQLDENDGTVCKYWPDTGSSQYGHITVDLKEEQKDNQYISRLFEVDHAHMKKPILVQHLQLTSWDENNVWDIYSFIKEMEKLQDDFKMVEPTVVHCINGVGRTGVIIAVISEMERIEAEEKVDVFTTVRQMRASNHNLIQTEEEYTLCYQLLNLSSPEATYANI